LRHEGVRGEPGSAVRGRGGRRKRLQATLWKAWAWINANPARYHAFARLLSVARGLQPKRLGPWTRTREAPRVARRSLHRLVRDEGFDRE
jgi:L-lactate dehydrogenase complex protein LldF